MNQETEFPWGDCKVAFDFDGDDEALLSALFPQETAQFRLPAGWNLNETDGSGARLVAIFRVDVELRREDGETVRAILRSIETANAPHEGPSGAS